MKGTGLERIRVWAVALAIAAGCGGSLGGTGTGGRGGDGGGGDFGGSGPSTGGGGGGDFGGSPPSTGGDGGGGFGGTAGDTGGSGDTGTGGSAGVPCAGSSTPCTAGQVCVHMSVECPVAACTPLPDGGQCPSGWTEVEQCGSGTGPGCEPLPCEPPPPHCANLPATCAGMTPSCNCLGVGFCETVGYCLSVSGSQVTCGSE